MLPNPVGQGRSAGFAFNSCQHLANVANEVATSD